MAGKKEISDLDDSVTDWEDATKQARKHQKNIREVVDDVNVQALSMYEVDKTGRWPASDFLAGYPGHKGQVAYRLIDFFPAHKVYLEPYAGLLGVLQRKGHSALEHVNDASLFLAAFLYCYTFPEMADQIKERMMRFRRSEKTYWIFKKKFEYMLEVNKAKSMSDDFTDECLMKLATFYAYLLKYSFSGQVGHQKITFDYRQERPVNYTFGPQQLDNFHERLRYVNVHNKDGVAFMDITKMNEAHSFAFVDPPYVKPTNLYIGGEFGMDKHEELADFLRDKWKGKFMLTYDDCDWTRKTYGDWCKIKKMDYHYTMFNTTSGNKKASELVITNYDPDVDARWSRRGAVKRARKI